MTNIWLVFSTNCRIIKGMKILCFLFLSVFTFQVFNTNTFGCHTSNDEEINQANNCPHHKAQKNTSSEKKGDKNDQSQAECIKLCCISLINNQIEINLNPHHTISYQNIFQDIVTSPRQISFRPFRPPITLV